MDEEGYISIVDREKYMYISENVYPAGVEKVFFTHSKVLDVAIIGVPDQKRGEVGKAYAVRKPGTTMEAGEILNFLGGKSGQL